MCGGTELHCSLEVVEMTEVAEMTEVDGMVVKVPLAQLAMSVELEMVLIKWFTSLERLVKNVVRQVLFLRVLRLN